MEYGKSNSTFDVDKVGCSSPICLHCSYIIQASSASAFGIYETSLFSCLVPYSHKDPTKWKTYEMHGYRKAYSKKTFKRVDQFKYDNNFNNVHDPKVLKYFTKSRKSLQEAWRKTYGFPYATAIPFNDGIDSGIPFIGAVPSNATKCFKKCARYVS